MGFTTVKEGEDCRDTMRLVYQPWGRQTYTANSQSTLKSWQLEASGNRGGTGMTRWELKAERRPLMFDGLSRSCKECVDYCNLRRSWGADLSCLTGHHGPGMTKWSSRDEKDCLCSTPIHTCEPFLDPPQPVAGQVPQAQVNQTSTKPSSRLPLQGYLFMSSATNPSFFHPNHGFTKLTLNFSIASALHSSSHSICLSLGSLKTTSSSSFHSLTVCVVTLWIGSPSSERTAKILLMGLL